MRTRVFLVAGAVTLGLGSLLIAMRSPPMGDTFFTTQQSHQGPPSSTAPASQVDEAPSFNSYQQLTRYPGKVVVAKPTITAGTIVAFTFGQSNAANHGGQKFTGGPRVFNYFDSKFYRAADPLLGATGADGGVFTLTANKLIAQGLADQVVLIAAGVSNTPVRDWRRGGALNGMLEARLKDAAAAGLTVTDFYWHQGESDNPQGRFAESAMEQYREGMLEVIELTRRYFPRSRFYVARTTSCAPDRPSYPPLLSAQTALAAEPSVFSGPNTDLIGPEDRYDGCHFSASGLEKHADGWIAAIRASRPINEGRAVAAASPR